MRDFILISLFVPQHILSGDIPSLLILVTCQIVNAIANEVIVGMTSEGKVTIERIVYEEEIIVGLPSRNLDLLDYSELLHLLDHSQLYPSHEFLDVLNKDIGKLLRKHCAFAFL